MISTIMIRTLMDERYYYGIRQEAAYVLAKVCGLLNSLMLITLVRNGSPKLARRVSSHASLSKVLLFSQFNNTNRQ